MNRLTTLTLMLIAGLSISVSSYAQTKKGPAYKNATISEKYKGHSIVLIRKDPNALKGPSAKNYHPHNEGNAILVTADLRDSSHVQANSRYKAVSITSAESKFDKGLKGPAFKNYKPNK